MLDQDLKIIVWAHNSHVGDATATPMGGMNFERNEPSDGNYIKPVYIYMTYTHTHIYIYISITLRYPSCV